MRLVAYTRVSTEEQAMEGTSLDGQLDQVREYCTSNNHEMVGEYRDAGFSGKDGDRPGLRRLLHDAGNGLFDGVVVSSMDRLARNLRLLLDLELQLRSMEIRLFIIKQSIDTSGYSGRMMFQVLGLIAEWEREAIIERTKGGRLRRYKEGRWGPGNVLYGYKYDRGSKKLVIDEKPAKIVRRIFDLYLSGNGMLRIAGILNEENIPPRTNRAKGWHSGAIRDVIVNSGYKGEIIVNRHCPISQLRHGVPKEAVKVEVPPIIDNDTWEAAQKRLSGNKHVRPVRVNPWLLQGMITCGECGHSFRGAISHGKRYYSCTGRTQRLHIDGSSRCTVPWFSADWLEGQVWGRIESIIRDPNKLEELLSDTIRRLEDKSADLYSRIRPLDEQLTEIAEKKRKLADAWVGDAIGNDEVDRRRRQLEADELRIKNMRDEMDPAQLAELQKTQTMLRFWQDQKVGLGWSVVGEDGMLGSSGRGPHHTVETLLRLNDEEVSKVMNFPATRREFLNLLQVKVIAFGNRVAIEAIFPIESVGEPLCSPTYMSVHSLRSR